MEGEDDLGLVERLEPGRSASPTWISSAADGQEIVAGEGGVCPDRTGSVPSSSASISPPNRQAQPCLNPNSSELVRPGVQARLRLKMLEPRADRGETGVIERQSAFRMSVRPGREGQMDFLCSSRGRDYAAIRSKSSAGKISYARMDDGWPGAQPFCLRPAGRTSRPPSQSPTAPGRCSGSSAARANVTGSSQSTAIVLKRQDDGVLVKQAGRSGNSTHLDALQDSGEYPSDCSKAVQVDWNPQTTYFLCFPDASRVHFRERTENSCSMCSTYLTFPGVQQAAANEYMVTCHGLAPGKWESRSLSGYATLTMSRGNSRAIPNWRAG